MDYKLAVVSGETPGKQTSYSSSGRVTTSSDYWVRPALYITAATVSVLGAAYVYSSSSVRPRTCPPSSARRSSQRTSTASPTAPPPTWPAPSARASPPPWAPPRPTRCGGTAAAAALPAGSGLAPGLQGPSGADRESVLSALASATEGFSAEQLRGLVGAALVLGPMAAVEAQVQELEQGLKAWEASRTALAAEGSLAAVIQTAAALVRRADALARALPPLTPEHLRQALRQAQAARLLGLK
ncbi:hypothetical protein HYH03_009059 [Edaphochlamys debaryana]|uniref:Uncharacterized protein n=1 Tax=Edaphochlamys debaryana TaxID=47281 RepID=A0A836BYT0_9CHLO|nr:hypothetical protein HYH03_009059 [Edaphochlamys debaryana]|eukprot:KAG2492643.1 hypothetical protein HYH03_009059 [Edaphochlamys debaryana]